MAMWAFVIPVRLFMFGSSYLLQNIGFSEADMMEPSSAPWMALKASSAIVTIASFWPEFVLMVKRLHDLGWSGIFAAPVFYPLAWGIVTFTYMNATNEVPHSNTILSLVSSIMGYYPMILTVILALFPGRKTSNRFGPPVTGPSDEAARHF